MNDNRREGDRLEAARALSLIFDADDTLWHSNTHFLEAEAEFAAALEAMCGVAAEAVCATIRRHEVEVIRTHGYGRGSYIVALNEVVAMLAPPATHRALAADVERIGNFLLERHCEPLPDVAPTLAELARRHRLLLFTKGDPIEQLRKLERSGFGCHFSRVEVPREKDEAAYRRLVIDAGLDPARTVMIGNSPRSDINPALKAGLRAVFIPYPHTWELEHEEIELSDRRVTVISAFRDLLDLF